uniref:Uncharacterized protein n=1 Tax=Medicago truncatula TaxID=3880 RepID=I3STE8_MEDTR|nr:unknown [Medicago truncatula]
MLPCLSLYLFEELTQMHRLRYQQIRSVPPCTFFYTVSQLKNALTKYDELPSTVQMLSCPWCSL